MPSVELVRRASGRALRIAAAAAFIAPLLTRLVLGQAFYQTGGGKLANLENVVSFFAGLGIPHPELNAAFVSRLEYYGGIALVLGLLTRVVAAGLASTMVVALLTADKESFVTAFQGAGDTGLTDVTPVVYLLLLVWLVFFGPGALSADRLLAWVLRPAAERPRAASRLRLWAAQASARLAA